MGAGNLVEQGTHESLYQEGGIYYQLVEKQRIMTKNKEEGEVISLLLLCFYYSINLQLQDGAEVEMFNVPNQAVLVGNNNVKPNQPDIKLDIVNLGESGMLVLPNAAVMTAAANERRSKEKRDMKVMRKDNKERDFTLEVVKRMKPHWHLLCIGVIGAALAGSV